MLTQNYYNLIANMIASGGHSSFNYGQALVLIDTFGVPHMEGVFYSTSSFPYDVTATPRLSRTGTEYGIIIGTDGTAASLTDINLGNQIFSGVSMSLTLTERGCNTPGIPYVKYKVSVTNTGSEPITIREIGYRQGFLYGSSSQYAPVLLDRTVLDEPLTIQAGDAGIIDYTLQTLPVERTKNGVKLVSFTYGSDEDVSAMIDAAHNGLIDLQADAGWRIGEPRKIHVDAWTGGGSAAHSAQDICIAISQFGDYNNCGCVLQFDFVTVFSEDQRMHSSATNVGGYGATEMYTTTLPSLVEALPSWLKTRLKTFSVVASKGNKSTELEVIEDNKLALRSAWEVSLSPGSESSSFSGGTAEGQQIDYYSNTFDYSGTRQKSGGSSYWWFRSPALNSTGYFGTCSNGSVSSANPTSQYALAPFGCL